MKRLIQDLAPPIFLRWWRSRRSALRWDGDYRSWADALGRSAGYGEAQILDRVRAAARRVRDGGAAFERDGMDFQEPEYVWTTLAMLEFIAASCEGRLDLVDFGGALGSTWRQHREALKNLVRVRWRVVEQPHYVEAGREFADAVLVFYASLDDALAEGTVSTVLFSSVLPYLEQPQALLAEVARKGVRHVIIDRTSFAADGRERIVVQKAPPELGRGSYPCWLFARNSLLAPLASCYRLVGEWPGFDDVDPSALFYGFSFERNG